MNTDLYGFHNSNTKIRSNQRKLTLPAWLSPGEFMILYRFPIIAACVTCFSFIPSYSRMEAKELTSVEISTVFEVAQADSFESLMQKGQEAIEQQDYQTALQNFQQANSLRPDSESAQQSLRNAQAYAYDQYMTQGYEASRSREYQAALQNFQQARQLRPDDFYAQQAINNIEKYQNRTEVAQTGNIFWLLLGLAIAGGLALGAFFLWGRNRREPVADSDYLPASDAPGAATKGLRALDQALDSPQHPENNASSAPLNRQIEEQSLPIQQTTRLPNLDIVGELVKDLQEPDPRRRRKAIWELAQRGDSRAVKPLVAIMTQADSHERSLILAALSQICVRVLKPINQALAISLQDDNAQVRKNAIRDSTKIYDLMLQVRQLLQHAASDPETEVRETAQWALKQLEMKQKPLGSDPISFPHSSNSSAPSPTES